MGNIIEKKVSINPGKILNNMINGMHIKIGEYVYAMTENYEIGILMDEKNISGLSYLTVGQFINLLKKMTDEEKLQAIFRAVVNNFD